MEYTVKKAISGPRIDGGWDDEIWSEANELSIDNFHERSKSTHPVTKAKVLHDNEAVYVLFKVEDKYVRAVAEKNQDSVCRDSCVEFFVKPKEDKGYFNFEINCGGTILLSYVRDPERTENGFKDFEYVSDENLKKIEIYHSMPKNVEPEIEDDTVWYIEYRVPKSMFEAYVGELGELSGQTWTANFYKCADETSHPHWAMWNPVTEPLNFHKPECFQPIHFE
jgi:hypothetical protein